MRVICPDVGGGFGTKLFMYREYAADRRSPRENCRSPVQMGRRPLRSFHGRHAGPRQSHDRDDGARAKDGRFLAMDVDLVADMGAYLSQFGPYIPMAAPP